MASRIGDKARKRKEEEIAAASEGAVRRRQAIREQLSGPAVQQRKTQSDTIKDILKQSVSAPSSFPRTSVLDPPTEPNLPPEFAKVTTYNPETQRHAVEVKSPSDIQKDIVDITPSSTKAIETVNTTVAPAPVLATLPATPAVQRYEYVYNPVTKTRTKQLVTTPAVSTSEERKQAIAAQASSIVDERAKYSLTEAERVETQKAMQDRKEMVEKLGLDPNRKYSGSYLQEIEKRQNDPFKPILEGLTFVADNVITNVAPLLGGPIGALVSQAYKNFAPPTSKFYKDVNFEDKVVSFLADNAQDKAKDLLMGQLKNLANVVKIGAKGYQRVGKESVATLTDRVAPVQGASSKIIGGKSYTEGANIRAATTMRTKPDFGSATVGPLARGPTQAPQRLAAQRTDVLVSPRGARGAVRPIARGGPRPVVRT